MIDDTEFFQIFCTNFPKKLYNIFIHFDWNSFFFTYVIFEFLSRKKGNVNKDNRRQQHLMASELEFQTIAFTRMQSGAIAQLKKKDENVQKYFF